VENGDQTAADDAPPATTTEGPSPKEPALADYEYIRVELPMATSPWPGFIRQHVDLRLSRRQASALNRLFVALDRVGERLENGKRVVSAADAIRWLLEHLESDSE
jgi:hypothetical protein